MPLQELGEIPESILKRNGTYRAIDFAVERRGYASGEVYCGGPNDRTEGSGFYGAIGGKKEAPLSRFPQNVGRLMLLLYTATGDTVIDPFAGHNSRMELCWRHNRNYVGCDICAEFMTDNRRIAEILRKEAAADMFGSAHYQAQIHLAECDSRCLPISDGEGDFTITSPPYWDSEYYGPEPQQLGEKKTYTQFLAELLLVAQENFRVLKPGAFCVWFVNDFRREGRFYSYHEDAAAVLREAGFVQHDIAIIDLGPAMRAAFHEALMRTKILPKRHEYALIFQKP